MSRDRNWLNEWMNVFFLFVSIISVDLNQKSGFIVRKSNVDNDSKRTIFFKCLTNFLTNRTFHLKQFPCHCSILFLPVFSQWISDSHVEENDSQGENTCRFSEQKDRLNITSFVTSIIYFSFFFTLFLPVSFPRKGLMIKRIQEREREREREREKEREHLF